MISFELNGIKYASPTWGSVTLKRYLSFLREVKTLRPSFLEDFLVFEEGEEIDVFKRWNAMKFSERMAALKTFATELAFWCGAPLGALVGNISPNEVINGWVSLQLDLNPNTASIDEDFTGFTFKEVHYTLPDRHLRGTTLGQYADAANFQTAASKIEGGHWESMANVIAALSTPVGSDYDFGENHVHRAALFLDLPMDVVLNIAFFLHRQNITFMSNILIYSMQKEAEALRQKLML